MARTAVILLRQDSIGASPIYTVPAGKHVIFRLTSSGNPSSVKINGVNTFINKSDTISGYESVPTVLPSGSTLQVQNGANGSTIVTGFEFDN